MERGEFESCGQNGCRGAIVIVKEIGGLEEKQPHVRHWDNRKGSLKQDPPKTSACENAAHLLKRESELREPRKGFLPKTAAEETCFPRISSQGSRWYYDQQTLKQQKNLVASPACLLFHRLAKCKRYGLIEACSNTAAGNWDEPGRGWECIPCKFVHRGHCITLWTWG